MRWCAGFLAVTLLAGCGKGGGGSKNASSNSSGQSSSKDDGKVYTSSKPGGGANNSGQSSGGGTDTALPSPADTADGKASPASDNGSTAVTKGLPVVNPGVSPANKPAPKGSH